MNDQAVYYGTDTSVSRPMIEDRYVRDEDGLPVESFDAFSEDPLEFEEMTVTLRRNLRAVYELTGRINRYSRNYPVVCRQMEQMIKRLGSCLVTKAALEYKGIRFSAENNMDIRELYSMVSFNFRKTDAAFREGKEKNRCADMGLLEQQCRLADLADRLKSTEEKIRLIRAGKTDIDGLLERVKMYKGQKAPAREKQEPRYPSGKAPSLPLITSVMAQLLRARKAEERREREEEKLLNADPFGAKPFKPLSKKEFMDFWLNEKKAGKQKTKPAEPAPSQKTEVKSYIKDAVEKMRGSSPVPKPKQDPKSGNIMDESMRRIFEAQKRSMGQSGREAHLPGRVK